MTIRTRFAPSPTGYLHIGGARTALFSWLYARRHSGEFILRIEDTDRERSTQASVVTILEGMQWLGLDHDLGPYYQSERFERYRQAVQQLIDRDQAYRCYCTRAELEAMRAAQLERGEKPRYDGRCRHRTKPPPGAPTPVIRFKNPQHGEVAVDDLVCGRVTFANSELDDLVIARSDGSPTYNLTVVIDDLDMAITHVVRGDDHLNNTPRQINILAAVGATPPYYAHVPMIRGADGKRLSKRHGAVSVLQYREAGYLPQALLNYLVRLGWAHGDQELFSMDEMIRLFDIRKINRAAAAFDTDKLRWINQQHLQDSADGALVGELQWLMHRLGIELSAGPSLPRLIAVQKGRCKTLAEMAASSRFFYEDFEDYDPKAAAKHLKPAAADMLDGLCGRLAALPQWAAEGIHAAVAATCEEYNCAMGKVAQPVRVAVSGGAVSPPIDATLELLGRERTLARITRAVDVIRGAPQSPS